MGLCEGKAREPERLILGKDSLRDRLIKSVHAA
jgi:hypothetical protein